MQNSLSEAIAANARLWFAFAGTWSSNRMSWTRGSRAAKRSTISGVASVLALSMTLYSQLAYVWRSTLSRHSSRYRAPLYTGVTTLTSGCLGVPATGAGRYTVERLTTIRFPWDALTRWLGWDIANDACRSASDLSPSHRQLTLRVALPLLV